MKFELTTSSAFYTEEEANKLKDIGFTFKTINAEFGCLIDLSSSVQVEIESLEDLIDFSKKWGRIIIFDGEIEIYDGYRE